MSSLTGCVVKIMRLLPGYFANKALFFNSRFRCNSNVGSKKAYKEWKELTAEEQAQAKKDIAENGRRMAQMGYAMIGGGLFSMILLGAWLRSRQRQ